jgi:hypothetical protein
MSYRNYLDLTASSAHLQARGQRVNVIPVPAAQQKQQQHFMF